MCPRLSPQRIPTCRVSFVTPDDPKACRLPSSSNHVRHGRQATIKVCKCELANGNDSGHDQLFAMLGLGRYEGHDAQLTIDEIVEKYHITDRNNVIQKVKHGLMDLFPPANEQDIRWYKHWLRNMERLRVRLVKPLNSTLPAGEARENTPCMLHFYEFMTRTCLGFTKEGGRPRDRTKKAADTQVAMGSEVETGEMLSANTFDDGSGVAALNSNAEERLYPMPDNGSGSSFDRNVFTANGRPAIPSSSFHMIETPAQSTPVLESERSLQNNFFAANDESANPSLSLPIVETPTQIFEESTAAKVTDVETPTAGSMTGRHNLETPMLRLDDKKRPRETESEQPAASVSEDEDEETVQRHSKRSKLGKDTGGAGHHWQGSEIETEYVAESLNEMTARVDAEQMAQQNLLQGFAYDIRQEEQFNLQGGFNEGLGAPDFLSSEDQWAHPQRIGSTFMAMEPNSWAPNFRLAPIEAVPQVEEVQQVPAKNYGPYYCLNAEYTQARYH